MDTDRPAGNPGRRLPAGQPLAVHSFGQWRAATRDLLARHVAPQAVQWVSGKHDGDLLSNPVGSPEAQAEPGGAGKVKPVSATLRIPRQLMNMLQRAACCRVPDRWAFLYQVLWRWRQGEDVLSATDADGSRLHAMVEAVRREEHRMLATLRFRERREDAGPPRFVAWCEPGHDVLPQLARHFARRMARVTWMIATPDAGAIWDGSSLHATGAPMRGPEEINHAEDARAALWLMYFSSIYHPARLKAELRLAQASEPDDPARGEIPATLDQCRRCDLWKNATQGVGGAGPKRARIMLVGEQPGDQEDLAGLPFVGPAGQLLDRALEQAELDRGKVYLTNAVKHFKWEPRGKRRMHKTPAQREVDACSYWLEGELASVRPKVVVALGSTALKAVTGNPHATLKDVIGKPFMHKGRWIVTIYHPSYVLRVPGGDNKARAFGVMVAGLRQAHALADEI